MSMNNEFMYGISKHAPFQDAAEAERVRNIRKEDLANHPNPEFRINIIPDDDVAFLRIHDLFSRIKDSAERGEKLVLILPQPHPQYTKVAHLINKYRINCRHLYTFNMDEWADEEGNSAPETWSRGFMYAMLNNFYYRIDETLRPPRSQVQGPTTKNIGDYGKMIEDLGGADLCDGGIGWSGHVAFVEPGSPEFTGDLEEFKQMGPRVVTLTPFTLAQSCLDADFGMSGDWSSVPPKALTIGPAQVLGAKLRNSWNSFNISGTALSWQRFTVRLAMHGPITPEVPASILQVGPTNMYVSETIAENIEDRQGTLFYS